MANEEQMTKATPRRDRLALLLREVRCWFLLVQLMAARRLRIRLCRPRNNHIGWEVNIEERSCWRRCYKQQKEMEAAISTCADGWI
jgi:hypothetical protein